jgi:hypothetical protein
VSFISEEKFQVISVVTISDLSLFIRHGLLLPVLVNLTRTLRQDFGKLEHTWFSEVCLCSIPENTPLTLQ